MSVLTTFKASLASLGAPALLDSRNDVNHVSLRATAKPRLPSSAPWHSRRQLDACLAREIEPLGDVRVDEGRKGLGYAASSVFPFMLGLGVLFVVDLRQIEPIGRRDRAAS